MRNLRNDIALLQLDGSISTSSKVNTVCLPSSGNKVPAGTRCYITGKELNCRANISKLEGFTVFVLTDELDAMNLMCMFNPCGAL